MTDEASTPDVSEPSGPVGPNEESGPPLLPRYRARRPRPRQTRLVPTSNLAIISLVTGLVGVGILQPIIGPLAVILGHAARREIRQAPTRLSGEGLATAGIVIGWVDLGIGVFFIALLLWLPGLWSTALAAATSSPTQQQIARQRLRQIGVATAIYAQDAEGHLPPNLATLVRLEYLDLAPETWLVPDSGGDRPLLPTDVDSPKADFLYRGGSLTRGAEDAGKTVVIHTKELGPERWVAYWFLDGSIRSTRLMAPYQAARKEGWILPGGG